MIAQSLIPELRHEYAGTRKMPERVPAASSGWMPHEKSMMPQKPAIHLAALLQWITVILSKDELDINKSPFNPPAITGNKKLINWFDTTSKVALDALQAANDNDEQIKAG